MLQQLNGKTFPALLQYYINCLQQEDIMNITFDIQLEGTKFFSNIIHQEELFHLNRSQIVLQPSEETERFLQTSNLQNKKDKLFYGYPLYVTPLGTVSPLFFTELQYERKDETILFTAVSQKPRLNHHLLIEQKIHPEEIQHIIKKVEEFENFSDALQSLLELLHLHIPPLSQSLDKKSLTVSSKSKIMNKAIFYYGQQTDITHNLLVELRQIQNKSIDDLARTSLYLLLSNERSLPFTSTEQKKLLEVFPMNPSQEQAVHSVLTQPLTVITGPPGTGKSQVVLNIIANAIFQNKTVLFASKNNKAVDVVIEKFNTLFPYKILVRMGHRAHRRKAKIDLENQFREPFSFDIQKHPPQELDRLPYISDKITTVREQMKQRTLITKTIFEIEQHRTDLQKQLPEIFSVLWNHQQLPLINRYHLQKNIESLLDDQKIINKILVKIRPQYYQQKKHGYFLLCSENFPIPLKTYLITFYKENPKKLKLILQWIVICKKIENYTKEIEQLIKKIQLLPTDSLLTEKIRTLQKEKITISLSLLNISQLQKFLQITDDEKAHISKYFLLSEQLENRVGDPQRFRTLLFSQIHTFQEIQHILPAWVVTNLSAKHSFPLKNNLFDLLIIDEASQCDITSALPLFYRAKHLAVIGDPNQLKHISLLPESHDRELAEYHHIEHLFCTFSYTKFSLYDLMEKLLISQGKQPILLNEHYRSHQDIIEFSNEYYYEKKLNIATDTSRLLPDTIIHQRVIWYHIEGETNRSPSPYNDEEANAVVEQILKLVNNNQRCYKKNISIGVVTLFRAQAERISEKIAGSDQCKNMDITIGTAHKFQGDEKDVIFFSPAVSHGVKDGTLYWIRSTKQLVNVAVTRARSLFVVIGDRQVCSNALGPLHDLVTYIKKKEDEYKLQMKIQ